MPRRKKKKHEQHENHERWLVSYADFITLLFAFFVVMYSISSVNEGKYRVVSDSIISAFNTAPRSTTPVQIGTISSTQKQPDDSAGKPEINSALIQEEIRGDSLDEEMDSQPEIADNDTRKAQALNQDNESQRKENLDSLEEYIRSNLLELEKNSVLTIKKGENWVEIELNNNTLFPVGSAELDDQAVIILKKIADSLKAENNLIRVGGFTDNIPIQTQYYRSNWELSSARAVSVVHLLADSGVSPSRLAATGFAEFQPIADNSTEDGRRKNRRVSIVVLNKEEGQSFEDFDLHKNQINN